MTEWSDKSEREVAELLAQLRVDPADDGFGVTLSARLAQAARPTPAPTSWRVEMARRLEGLMARPWLIGSCSGALSGVAVFALLQWSQISAPRVEPPTSALALGAGSPGSTPSTVSCPAVAEVAAVEVFAVPAGKVALVHFQFDVEQAVEAAEFSVLLPPGLAFYGDGEPLKDRVFRWEAPLSAGENRVPVAILGEAPGPHRVTATATVGSQVVVHELVLDVREAV